MDFHPPLTPARLVRRYKRFLADVVLEDGTKNTVHCPNTGAMLGCDEPGSRVWLAHSDNPRRKYAHTWEIVETPGGVAVGINTARTNGLVREALVGGLIAELRALGPIESEVRVGEGRSRIDFRLLDPAGGPACYLEVKNVTAVVEQGVALFPDAVSTRATRHLRELVELGQEGHRSVLCFCVQRADVEVVRPAVEIDPAYAEALAEAHRAGVELLAYRARVSPERIELRDRIAVRVD